MESEIKIKSKVPDCQYNKMRDCPPSSHDCNRCGWNPEVMNARLERLYGPKKKEEKKYGNCSC